MLNKIIFSFILVFFFNTSVDAQKDPKNSVFLCSFDVKSAMLDYMPLNDSNLVVMKSLSGENYIEVVGSSSMRAVKLEIEHPIGFYKDSQNEVYLMTADSAYRMTFGTELTFNSPENIVPFKLRVNEINSPLKTRFKGLYSNGRTDLVRYTEEGVTDTISFAADYRSSVIKNMGNRPTADLTGKRPVLMRGRYAVLGGGHTSFDIDSASGRPLMVDKEPFYSARQERTRGNQYSSKSSPRRHELYEPNYIMDGEKILVVDGDGINIARYSANGILESIHQIDYARPIVWSGGDDEFSYNTERNELFICSTNSKGYQFSRLDPETGFASLIFKTKKYWRLSNSKIVGNTIYYVQSNSFGLDELYSVSLL